MLKMEGHADMSYAVWCPSMTVYKKVQRNQKSEKRHQTTQLSSEEGRYKRGGRRLIYHSRNRVLVLEAQGHC